MAKENTAGLGVYNVYGPRTTAEGRSGDIRTDGVEKELELDFRGDNYSLVSATLPKGAKFLSATVKIVEAFNLGGTSPTILVGTSGSAATNYGVSVSEANAEAAGTVVFNATGAGTWANPLAAATTVAVALGGTSPTATSAGLAKVVVRYLVV